MATQQVSWSVRVEALRARAERNAAQIIGTTRKVRLDKNTCFCGTVKTCMVDIREVPERRADAIYTITLAGPAGFPLTYRTRG